MTKRTKPKKGAEPVQASGFFACIRAKFSEKFSDKLTDYAVILMIAFILSMPTLFLLALSVKALTVFCTWLGVDLSLVISLFSMIKGG